MYAPLRVWHILLFNVSMEYVRICGHIALKIITGLRTAWTMDYVRVINAVEMISLGVIVVPVALWIHTVNRVNSSDGKSV